MSQCRLFETAATLCLYSPVHSSAPDRAIPAQQHSTQQSCLMRSVGDAANSFNNQSCHLGSRVSHRQRAEQTATPVASLDDWPGLQPTRERYPPKNACKSLVLLCYVTCLILELGFGITLRVNTYAFSFASLNVMGWRSHQKEGYVLTKWIADIWKFFCLSLCA